MSLLLVRTATSRSDYRLADQKEAIFFQGSPFPKGIERVRSTLKSESGVEVDLPIGTTVTATKSAEAAEAAGYRSRLPKTW